MYLNVFDSTIDPMTTTHTAHSLSLGNGSLIIKLSYYLQIRSIIASSLLWLQPYAKHSTIFSVSYLVICTADPKWNQSGTKTLTTSAVLLSKECQNMERPL